MNNIKLCFCVASTTYMVNVYFVLLKKRMSLHRHCDLKIRDPTCKWRSEPWLLEEEYGPVVKSSFELLDVAAFTHRFAAVSLRTRTRRGRNNVRVIYWHIMHLAAPFENTWLSVSTLLMRAALSSDTREHKIRLILSNLYGKCRDSLQINIAPQPP